MAFEPVSSYRCNSQMVQKLFFFAFSEKYNLQARNFSRGFFFFFFSFSSLALFDLKIWASCYFDLLNNLQWWYSCTIYVNCVPWVENNFFMY